MASFQEILSKPAAEIKPPSAMPVGTYLAIVEKMPEFVKIGKEQTDASKFIYKFMQAQQDVDQAEMIKALDGKPLQDVRLTKNWFITEAASYRLKDHIVNDLAVDEGTKSLGELIPEAMGRQVLITVGHRASEDGKAIYMDAKGFAKV